MPARYSYTGAGEQQRVGAGSTKYQYDATGLNVQTDSVNNKTYFTSLPDGTLLSETIPGGVANAGTYYYLSDGPGNVAAVVDSTGTVRNSYTYDPLGAPTVAGFQQVSNPFTFQGWMFDSQTGYYYTGSGYYDPATGQSFGCHDRGRVDPGEDLCGEEADTQCGGDCPGPDIPTTRVIQPLCDLLVQGDLTGDCAGGGGGDRTSSAPPEPPESSSKKAGAQKYNLPKVRKYLGGARLYSTPYFGSRAAAWRAVLQKVGGRGGLVEIGKGVWRTKNGQWQIFDHPGHFNVERIVKRNGKEVISDNGHYRYH